MVGGDAGLQRSGWQPGGHDLFRQSGRGNPLQLLASLARMRGASSPAALRVKVTPRISSGRTQPLATSQTTRSAIVAVLPDPAPAMTSRG